MTRLASIALLLTGCVFDRVGIGARQPAADVEGGGPARIEASAPIDTGGAEDPPDAASSDGSSDAPSSDTRPSPDLLPSPDALPWPDLPPPPDTLATPDSSPCLSEHFTGAVSSWKVTPERGDWVWKSPSFARQQKIDSFGAHALVQGSASMAQSFVASTTVTVTGVVNNGAGQGGGLSLVVREVRSNRPVRQAMCVAWIYGPGGSAKLGLAYYTGSSWTAYPFKSKNLSFSPEKKPATYTFKIEHKGGKWNGACMLALGSKTETVTADVSSIVDATPQGVALFTTGVTADFDQVEVCPAP